MENNNTTQNVAQPEFEKQKIGEEKWFDSASVRSVYEIITDSCTNLKNQLQNCLEIKISIDDFLNFLKSNPEKWIYNKYIEINNVKFNGLSNDKIIELKMLDINKVAVGEVLQQFAGFNNVLGKLQNNTFYYPLRKLYDEEQEIFYTTGDLWEAIDNRFTIFTQTPEQNKILDIINRLCGVLNELEELNILRSKNGPVEIEQLANYVKIGKNSSPFVVNPHLFRQHRLNKFKTNFQENEYKNINLLYA